MTNCAECGCRLLGEVARIVCYMCLHPPNQDAWSSMSDLTSPHRWWFLVGL